MSVSTNAAAKAPIRRTPREALDRWLAQADALLADQGDPAVEPARGAA